MNWLASQVVGVVLSAAVVFPLQASEVAVRVPHGGSFNLGGTSRQAERFKTTGPQHYDFD